MIYLKALILSIIESITEFIPVSSTAHLIFIKKYLDFNIEDGGLFEVVIQLAAILVVCVLYRKKLLSIVLSLKKRSSQDFAAKFILAFIPSAITGLFLYKYIKLYVSSDLFISLSLIFGGIVLFYVENMVIKQKYKNVNDVNFMSSLKIGLYQAVAIIPGVSRSGSTIVGGLISGLNRKTAVEFSFILAIPTIFGATIFKLIQNINYITPGNIKIISFGFICSFILSSIAVKLLLKYISEHTLKIFAYYRIILGIIILLSKI